MQFATLVLSVTILTGCFPNNASHRRTAKWIEGGALAGGIAFLAVSNTGADCTAGPGHRAEYDSCRHQSTILGTAGLALIIAGLAGFAATTITTPDEKPKAPLQPLAQGKPLASDEIADAPKPALPNRTATRPNKH